MKKSSVAKIMMTSNSLYVRFEKVGPKSKFDAINNRWKENFPQSYWNNKQRAYELPVANLEMVKDFCDKMFWQVRIEPFNSPQLPLF